MDILDRYIEELKQDIQINLENVRDIQMKLPAIKHKWAARLVNTKLEISKKQKLCFKVKEELQKKLNEKIQLSNNALSASLDRNESIAKIYEEIDNLKMVVEYLEKVEKILSSTTYDIKNLVELMKMEQM